MAKPPLKRRLLGHALNFVLSTAAFFGVIYLVLLVSLNVELFNPLEKALSEVDFTDLIFAEFRGQKHEQTHALHAARADTNIVLVNIGTLNRAGVASQLAIINRQQPKVVGLDAFFRGAKSPMGDSLLASELSQVENLVLVSELSGFGKTEGDFDTLLSSHPRFARHADLGFANLITAEKDRRVVRTFSPIEKVGGQPVKAFALQVAEHYYPKRVEKFLAKNREETLINYRRTQHLYPTIDAQQLFKGEYAISLKDKIVLMGYLGDQLHSHSWEDKFYTPLNGTFLGKSMPDMFGLVIHANIISMVAEGSHIRKVYKGVVYLLCVLACLLNYAVFIATDRYSGGFQNLVMKAMQFGLSIVVVFVAVFLFKYYNYKLSITLILLAIFLFQDFFEIYHDLLSGRIMKLIGAEGLG